jgi:multidrug efflux pump subunit AcrA (membrane-fusion protein)
MFGKIINLNRVLTFLAILGIISGVYMLLIDRKAAPIAQPLLPPATPPFESFVSGAGIVEAASENIALGTMVSATVDTILVRKGDIVPQGQPLFTLTSDQAEADLKTKRALLDVAKTALEQAKASLKYALDELNLVNQLEDKRGVTKEELINRQDNVLIAQKGVENAEAGVKSAQTQVDESQVILNFYTVKAPIDCEIMQINIRPGEYAAATALGSSFQSSTSSASSLMLIGNVNRYHIRVDIDENDAWRFNKDQPAVAFLRGNAQYHTSLKFEYLEPYVVPKRSLTGDPTERVDTRVLQVVYSYDPKSLPAYLGQEVDVYIRAVKISSDVQYGGPLPVSR